MYDKFIDEIVSKMKRREIKRSDMARRLGVEQSTLGKYLLKRRAMPLDVALMLALQLEVDISYICGLQFDRAISDNEIEILNALKKVPEQKRTSVILALLNVINVIHDIP